MFENKEVLQRFLIRSRRLPNIKTLQLCIFSRRDVQSKNTERSSSLNAFKL